jgi:hypothetical protein
VSFIERQLDPSDILGEILFGLIMVLTLTLGAAIASGYERGLILAAIGCNVAWGVIDAVLVVMGSRYARHRHGRLVRAIRSARDEKQALALIRDEFESGVEVESRPEDRERLNRSIHEVFAHARPRRMTLGKDDWLTAVAVFVLVVAPALPAVLPFLFVENPHHALRLSNALLIGLLFVVGYLWGRHVDLHPWLAAFVLTALGVALAGIAIALGG